MTVVNQGSQQFREYCRPLIRENLGQNGLTNYTRPALIRWPLQICHCIAAVLNIQSPLLIRTPHHRVYKKYFFNNTNSAKATKHKPGVCVKGSKRIYIVDFHSAFSQLHLARLREGWVKTYNGSKRKWTPWTGSKIKIILDPFKWTPRLMLSGFRQISCWKTCFFSAPLNNV